MKKKLLIATIFSLFTAISVFAEINARGLAGKFDSLSSNLNYTSTALSALQNVYAEAWIEKLYPDYPPHLGAGIEGGIARFDISSLSSIVKDFKLPSLREKIFLPILSANFRLGGINLPFDFGFSFMTLNFSNLYDFVIPGLGTKILNLEADMRWAILKGKGAWPKISLGFGYSLAKGFFSYNLEGFNSTTEYKTHILFATAQISKKLLFFIPFLGFKGAFTKAKSSWNYKLEKDFTNIGNEFVLGAKGKNEAEKLFFAPQVYGGFAFRLTVIDLTFSALWDFSASIWGADFSLRFRL